MSTNARATVEQLEVELQEARYQLERVVEICLDSRQVEKDIQAVYLRDEILSLVDPLMNITGRIRERRAADVKAEARRR